MATPKGIMGRNLVVCLDGTNNQFGDVNTNVVRLIQVIDRDQRKQRIYYDPGVGTLPEPGVATWIGKKISEGIGLSFGAGLTWKVQEAYSYLMEMWEPDDRVFIFGFSRGAYSARVLAGVLHAFGLLPRGAQNMLPYMMRLYARACGERKALNGQVGWWQKLCSNFRRTFSRAVTPEDQERHFPVYFLGLWDTVSSVGWIWNPDKFPFTARNPSVQIARHAVSIDERRWFYRQNSLKQARPLQDLKEYWFAGVHSDVGGGYSELFSSKPPQSYAGIWRNSFEWMVQEAMAKGILIDEERYTSVLSRSPACTNPWLEEQHISLKKGWWALEFVPKQVWDSQLRKRKWEVGLGRHRQIPTGANIHKSVLERIRGRNYAPPNLGADFVSRAKALTNIPDSMTL
jgi:uncharacterized protein (DUF2235 family)